jgi:hypothetical protein
MNVKGADMATTRRFPVPPPRHRDEPSKWWIEWRWAPWAFAAWLLAIAGTAAALGTIDSAPGQDIPAHTFTVDAALAGLGFGLLFGLSLPRGLWQGRRWLAALAVGSGIYALSYFIAAAVGYGDGDNSDSGGMGLVFVYLAVVCFGPMLAAAALGALIRLTITAGRDKALEMWRGAQRRP